jgi:hypothetical protein
MFKKTGTSKSIGIVQPKKAVAVPVKAKQEEKPKDQAKKKGK